MQIDPSPSSRPVEVTGNSPTARPACVAADRADFPDSEALTDALAGAPDHRPALVQRAEGLLSIPNYPPAEAVRRLAYLFAIHLKPDSLV